MPGPEEKDSSEELQDDISQMYTRGEEDKDEDKEEDDKEEDDKGKESED